MSGPSEPASARGSLGAEAPYGALTGPATGRAEGKGYFLLAATAESSDNRSWIGGGRSHGTDTNELQLRRKHKKRRPRYSIDTMYAVPFPRLHELGHIWADIPGHGYEDNYADPRTNVENFVRLVRYLSRDYDKYK